MKCTLNMIVASLILACGMMVFSSCGKGNDSDVRKSARESLNVNDNEPATPPPANDFQTGQIANQQPPPTPPAQNASGEFHYICPNDCEGSGGATQVACPVCGTQYVHNQAYHNQAQQATTTTPAATGTPQTPQTPPTPEPAQNAAGVWHYTCPSGCEGGAGSPVACASCGTTLTHNSAYHN